MKETYVIVVGLQGREKEFVLPIFVKLLGSQSWTLKHVQTDWLAATWFFFYATLVWVIVSWCLLLGAENSRQIFIWVSSLVDALIFLVASMYYVAGRYNR
jgi:hypothetical protein